MNALIKKISNPPEQKYEVVHEPRGSNAGMEHSVQSTQLDIEKPRPPNNDDVDPNFLNRVKDRAQQPQQKPQIPPQVQQKNIIKIKTPRRRLNLKSFFRCFNSRRWETFCYVFAAILFVLLILSVLSMLIALMAIYFGRDPSASSLTATLPYIISNIKAEPIMNVELLAAGSTCSAGYEQLPLGRWPGTVDGCDCTAGGGVNAGDCPTESSCDADNNCSYYTPSDCHEISDVEGVNLPTWDNTIWCATKLKLGDTYQRNSPCPEGFKECWAGNCVRNGLDCPITDVILSNDAINADSRTYGASKYYTPIREQGKTSMIDVVITINEVPCFNPEEEPMGAPSYVLLDDEPEGCKTYGLDSAFSFKLQHMMQEQLLRGNSAPQAVFDLPGYIYTLRITDTYLVGRRKMLMGTHSTCLNMNLDQTSELLEELPRLDKVIEVCSIFAMVLHGLLIGILIGFGCAGAKEKAIYAFYIIFIAEIIIYAVMAGMVHVSLDNMEGVKDHLIDLNHHNCFPIGQPSKVFADIVFLITETAEVVRRLSFSLLGVSGTLLLVLSGVCAFIAKKY